MKKIVFAVIAAVLMIGTVAAFTACGVNGSPKSVVKASMEAAVSLDYAKMIDVLYFENTEDKDDYKKQLEDEMSGNDGGTLTVVGSITKFEFSSESVSDEELEAIKALYPGINVEAAENYTVTYSAKIKTTVTIGDVSTDTDTSVDDKEAKGIVYKIDGGWYMDIVPDILQTAE